MLLVCVSAVPPSPVMVLINPSIAGTQVAGSAYTLSCIALKSVSGLTQTAQIQWMGPNGAPLATNSNIVVASAVTGSLTTTQNITFNSLFTSDAGVYTCRSTLSSPALTTPYQTMQMYTIIISGKQRIIHSL